MKSTRIIGFLLALLLCLGIASGEVLCDGQVAMTEEVYVEYGADYSSKEEVALYLHAFTSLPENYLTKNEAQELGWVSYKGNLWKVAPGCSIGGNRFGNLEGYLPNAKGRMWYECDIDYYGGTRNAKRIVFSSDGLIYYTEDHYNTFELLYDSWYIKDAFYPLTAPLIYE